MSYRAPMTQLIEIAIPGAPSPALAPGQQVSFLPQQQLQSRINDAKVYIKAIDVLTNLDLAFSPFTAGNPVAAPADITNTYLTLSVNGVLQYNYLPLVFLHRIFLAGGGVSNAVYDQFLLRNVYKVDWALSFLAVVAAPATAAPFSYLFNITYSFCADPGDPAEQKTMK